MCQDKWNKSLNVFLNVSECIFNTISDSYSKSFQYRSLNGILGTGHCKIGFNGHCSVDCAIDVTELSSTCW